MWTIAKFTGFCTECGTHIAEGTRYFRVCSHQFYCEGCAGDCEDADSQYTVFQKVRDKVPQKDIPSMSHKRRN